MTISRNTRFSSIVANPTLGITIPSSVVNTGGLGTSSQVASTILKNKALYEVGDLLVGWLRLDTNGVLEAVSSPTLSYSSSMIPTSGTGVAFTRKGIYALNGGVTKFSLDAVTGNAMFGGTLQATVAIIGGTTIGQVNTDATNALATASAANATAASKMDSSSAYVMGGSFALRTSGYDGGNGVAITTNGLLGKKSGSTVFSIDTNGNAVFAGTLSAATGTFSGSISVGSAGLVVATSSSTFSNILVADSSTGTKFNIEQGANTIYLTSWVNRMFISAVTTVGIFTAFSGLIDINAGSTGTIDIFANSVVISANAGFNVNADTVINGGIQASGGMTATSFIGTASTASNLTSASYGTFSGNFIYEAIASKVVINQTYNFSGTLSGSGAISGTIKLF